MFLTFLTFLPLLGAVLLTLIPRDEEGAIKQTALAFAVTDFVLSVFLWTNFDLTTHEMQFEYSVTWITSWGVNYHVGLDGISLLLYVMTTFLTMISIIASWGVTKYIREYMIAFLALSFYLFIKKNPNEGKNVLSHANTLIRHMPIEHGTADMLSPIFDFTQ